MRQAAGTRTPVPIVALDFGEASAAMALVDELGDLCRFYKVGSELFTAAGPSVVTALRSAGCDVMLDLKFHDIPNTVARAVESARALGVRLLTVHATGGGAMLRAAADAAGAEGGECEIFAVTLLTSLDPAAASEIFGREPIEVESEVVRLARMAERAGVNGVVASGSEAESVKRALGTAFGVLVPGVRLAGSGAGDQMRVVTPAEASRVGADYVVIGRTVTATPDRRAAMELVVNELSLPAD